MPFRHMTGRDATLVAGIVTESGRRFYAALVREAEHPEARKIFAELAAAEVRPAAEPRPVAESQPAADPQTAAVPQSDDDVDRDGSAPDESGVPIDDERHILRFLRDLIRPDVFPEPDSEGLTAHGSGGDRAAVDAASAAERGAARFYEQAAEACETKDGKAAFLRLSEAARDRAARLDALEARLYAEG
jgi:rubrerythrin